MRRVEVTIKGGLCLCCRFETADVLFTCAGRCSRAENNIGAVFVFRLVSYRACSSCSATCFSLGRLLLLTTVVAINRAVRNFLTAFFYIAYLPPILDTFSKVCYNKRAEFALYWSIGVNLNRADIGSIRSARL